MQDPKPPVTGVSAEASVPAWPQRRSGAALIPLLVVFVVFAALLAAGLTAVAGGNTYTDLGLPDPGALTNYGLPVIRVLTEAAAVVSIGSLLFAAFCTPPQRSGMLAADGYAALRMAGWAAIVWCVGAVLMVPFTVSDSVGQPLTEVLRPANFAGLFDSLEQAKAWLVTGAIVVVLAMCCRLVLRWGATAALFFLALFGLFPQAVTGHSASGGAHDLATNSLLFHLLAAAIWIGGLVALLAHGHRGGVHLGLAARRFSAVALVCWIVMAVSGVLNAVVRLPPADVFRTAYGALVLVKIAALCGLGVFGYYQRRRGVRAIVERDSVRPLIRLAGAEILVMFATIGVAAALSHTAPPTDGVARPDTMAVLIGYDLEGPPTVVRLLTCWRFDLVYGTLAVSLAMVYLLGVVRLHRRGDKWSIGRTVAWLGGCLVLLLATSSGVGRYAPAMFSMHMVGHMMLNMLAPVLLTLGGPVTLALRALPVAGRSNPPGPREWLLTLVHSRIARLMTHPVVALVLFVGSFYALYFSGLFDAALRYHWAHLAMNAHFLLIGYMFYWPVVGVDPAPQRLPHLGRLGMLLASMPFHAFFGVILMNMSTVIGENFYRSLSLPWVNLASDQRLGGGIAWSFGEVPLILVMIALLTQWSRHDERAARRGDRRADSDGDADLAAYNAMLAKLSGKDT